MKGIAAAYLGNDQVRKIVHDKDVRGFIERLLQTRRGDMDDANAAAIEELLARPEHDVFWGIEALPRPDGDA